MTRRIPQTLTDYVLIAINPALIMFLVGSLTFFLIEVFYHGEYDGRLRFITAMYVMGVVATARISIEENKGHASMFGAPLALVTWIAMMKFVAYNGTLAGFSALVNAGLLALSWWSAHKLTWDCTVVTDAPDTSGQGLLQAVGLDGSAPLPARAAPVVEVDESRAATLQTLPEPLRNVAQWLERRRRAPHTPGVWVIYFSLAALPLFGLGQWFIPAVDQASRGFAFGCLVIYVACGLSLLMTTSFLGLRRYLGQKGIHVPLDITATWLTVGAAMIVALLIVAAILPRPNAGGRVAAVAYSPVQTPSKHGFGNDGPQDQRTGQRTGPQAKTGNLQGQSQSKDQSGGSSGQKGQSGSNSQPGGKQPGGKSSNQQSSNSSDKPNQSDKSNPSDSSDKSNGAKAGERGSDSKSQPQNSQPQDPQPPKPNSQNPQNQGNPSGGNSRPPQPPPTNQSPSSSSQQSTSQTPPRQSPPNQTQPAPQSSPASSPSNLLGSLGTLLKWLFYAAIACVAAFIAWKYREQIAAAWQQFLAELRAWWERLFGKKTATATAAQEAATASAPPPRPFADFADPFATGQAARWTPAQIVTYSFEAFEAWSRELGCPRAVDQTPAEFAQQVATHAPAVTRDARSLADLYSQVAYAKTLPSASSLEPLRRLWQQLRAVVARV